MNSLKYIVAGLCLVMMAGSALAADSAISKADIDRAATAIADYEVSKSRRPLSEVERIILSTRNEAQLSQYLEQQLVRVLETTASDECKQFICEKLWVIGTEQSIPVLAKMLVDEKTAHLACNALQTNPSPRASKALREAAGTAKGKALMCIAGVLGERRDAESVPMLIKLLKDSDTAIASAAGSALGRIGNVEAASALAEARKAARGELRDSLSDAYLRCATRLVDQSKTDQAKTIYQELFAKDEPVLYRRSALIGLVGLGGPEAVNLALAVLRDEEHMMQGTAIAQVPKLKGEGVTQRFTEQLPNLPVSLQAALIGALQERGDVAARPAIVAAVASDDADVRIAALKALSTLGDASSVALLARAAGDAKSEPEQRMAVTSLRQLAGEDVVVAIIQNMQGAKADARVLLIQVLSDRGAVAAVPALLKEAAGDTPAIRSSAFRALGLLAEPKDLPTMIKLLVSLPEDSSRADAERALVAVARKIADESQRSAAALAALSTAQQTPARLSLLRVLGAIADANAFAAARSALNDSSTQIRDEAVRILAAWPNAAASPTLLEIATGAADETHRVLALRGHIRLIGQSTDRSVQEKLAMYSRAMELARRPEEKRLVLAGMAEVKDVAALRMIGLSLNDSVVQEEAVTAAVTIARELVAIRPGPTKDVLRNALAVTKNAALRAEIEKIIKQAESLDSSLRGGEFEAIEAFSLFDGKALQGWEGPLNAFRVENGAIVGGSLKTGMPRNEFLTTKREFRDFELRLQFKVAGKGVNAGIQIRSRRIPNNHEMIGYQADLGDGYWGCLYDESRRNQVLARANDAELRKVLRLDDWNDYVIRCVGKRIQLWINGYQTVDYTEKDAAIEQTGLIGLQIHGGGPSEARYRDIVIKELKP